MIYAYLICKNEKKRTGWLKSTVLENGWELGGEIWQFFRLDAETFKSGVFLCNSKIWGISYDHIEHKWNEKKKNQDPKISRFSVLSKNYLRSYYGARIDPRWIFYALRSVWKIVWTGKRITQNQIMTYWFVWFSFSGDQNLNPFFSSSQRMLSLFPALSVVLGQF